MSELIMQLKTVLLGTVAYVVEYRYVLARALFIPFVIYLAIDAIYLYQPDRGASLLLQFVRFLVQVLFAITTHRIMLLGPTAVPGWGVLSWSRRETSFALHLVGLALLVTPAIIFVFVPVIGPYLTLGVVVWIFARLSLVFPAIASDQDMRFAEAWVATRNHAFMMIFVVAVFPALLMLPAYLFTLVPYSFALTSLFTSLTTVFTVTALSVAYKIVRRERSQTAI